MTPDAKPDAKSDTTAWLSLLLVQFLFGGLPVISKFVIAEVAPQVVVLCRSFTATLVFAALVFWRRRRNRARSALRPAFTLNTHLSLVALAALGVSFNQTILFYGLQRTTSAASAILAPMISVFALLISLSLRRETFTWPKLANITLGSAGVALIFAGHTPTDMGETLTEAAMLGNLMCLASAFCYASYLALSPPVIARIGSLEFSLAVFLYASALNVALYFMITGMSPLAIPAAILETLPQLTSTFWWALGYLVFGATVVTYLLNAYALASLSPGIVGGFVCMQTVIGVGLSHALLAEPFPPEHAVAMALVVTGVLCLWIPEWRAASRIRR